MSDNIEKKSCCDYWREQRARRSGCSAPFGKWFGRRVRRGGTPDEVGSAGALLMGADGGFITGSDFLMDGGVTAAYWYGELAQPGS